MRKWVVYAAVGWSLAVSLYGMGQALAPKARCEVFKPVLDRVQPDYRVHERKPWKM